MICMLFRFIIQYNVLLCLHALSKTRGPSAKIPEFCCHDWTCGCKVLYNVATFLKARLQTKDSLNKDFLENVYAKTKTKLFTAKPSSGLLQFGHVAFAVYFSLSPDRVKHSQSCACKAPIRSCKPNSRLIWMWYVSR